MHAVYGNSILRQKAFERRHTMVSELTVGKRDTLLQGDKAKISYTGPLHLRLVCETDPIVTINGTDATFTKTDKKYVLDMWFNKDDKVKTAGLVAIDVVKVQKGSVGLQSSDKEEFSAASWKPLEDTPATPDDTPPAVT
jgi:hypothetical protein